MTSGLVFDIQEYCIHDGPGIRTTVFLSGCPLGCLWCQNPESSGGRPKLFFLRERCTACGACVRACPRGAVHVEDVAITDRSVCTACGACVPVCPAEAREMSGRVMTAEEVAARVESDRVFYEGSGGGVTISGGEVLAQPDFAAEILRLCKLRGLHTAIETCGFGRWECFLPILEHTDMVLYDIKHMDTARHRQGTGADNRLILENARRIRSELKKPMEVRVPLIPGFNDDVENLLATARFTVDELGGDVEIRLLPYHALGDSKRRRMEDTSPAFAAEPPSEAELERLKNIMLTVANHVEIGG